MIDTFFENNFTTLVVNCSNEYVPYLDVCFQSVLDNSDPNHFYDLVVLNSTISAENQKYLESKYDINNFKIRFFDISQNLNYRKILDGASGYSKESFCKIIIPRLFPAYDKLIYADVDIIFNCDIKEIQGIDLNGYPISASRDFALAYVAKYDNDDRLRDYLMNTICIKDLFDYFAAGIIVYDLKNWKEEDVENMCAMAYSFQYWLQEQDVFNIYFNGKIFELPYSYCINTAYINKFNKEFFGNDKYYSDYKNAISSPKVIHYSGSKKPWHNWLKIHDDTYEKMWWKYAEKTRFYTDVMLEKLYLFIIWEKARHLEDEILKRIGEQFKILKKFAIQWDEDKFHDNIYSFGGGCLVNSNFHEYHKGKGEFLMVLVEDKNENLEIRKTAQDKMLVNRNIFDFKYKTRSELLNNMCSLHGSMNIKETRHDFSLLTGQSLKDFIINNKLDGETVCLKQNVPCVDGWKDLAHIFYILNETVDYAVLRNFEGLPDEVVVDEHTDIDILVDDMQNFISVLEGAKLRDNVFKIRVYANIQGVEGLFHCKYIGDDYYDSAWQKEILNSRIKNDKNIYVPDDKEYFYSLLYHALYQKTYVSNTYLPIFKELMPKWGLVPDTSIDNLKKYMESYLVENDYKITQPYENLDPDLHVSDTLLGRNNIDNPALIDDENKYYIVKSKHAVSIFNKKLAGINAKTATRFMFINEENRFEPFVNWNCRLYKIDAPELRNYRKYLKHNTLFVTFRKRFGHISIQKCKTIKDKKIITRRFLGSLPLKRKYKTQFLWMYSNDRREYKNGITITDIIKSLTSLSEKERVLDIFIGKVFDKFATKDFNYLKGIAFDMTTDNCLFETNGNWKFFDFEYEYRSPVPKSQMLYRIISNCGIDIDKYELYKKFAHKLCIPEQYYYFEDIEKYVFNSLACSPKGSKIWVLLFDFILIKSIRRKLKEKWKGVNYHYFKRIFGKENI